MPRALTPEQQRERYENRPEPLNRGDRPTRTPINGYRNKLTVVGQEEGFHYCWVNEGNVDRYIGAGYEFVTHAVRVGDSHVNKAGQQGEKVSMPGGNGHLIFLMRVPNEYYNEDMAEAQKQVDFGEAALKEQQNSKGDGMYGQVKVGRDVKDAYR